ncbi:PREDICTED: uncharacterized protein LOC109395868 isoform X2 [Hipposideros armiger]|uniref:Uncharacterized protein LOC109395868 isoform X2 n=1 Tax=Hipposideros armiger TaxID=186990 RepID=A0A8B7TDJ1_HIPAR|nr:PREDICTED: uncharacterized protein LOC109395868 isoform X2 [Hipposideros armiger]
MAPKLCLQWRGAALLALEPRRAGCGHFRAAAGLGRPLVVKSSTPLPPARPRLACSRCRPPTVFVDQGSGSPHISEKPGSSRTVWGEEEEPSSRNAHQQYPALEGTAHKERGPEPLRFVKEELGLLPAQLVLRAFASRGRTCTSFSSCGWESGVLLHRRTEQDCTQRLPREAFKAKCKGRPHWQPGPGDLNGR